MLRHLVVPMALLAVMVPFAAFGTTDQDSQPAQDTAATQDTTVQQDSTATQDTTREQGNAATQPNAAADSTAKACEDSENNWIEDRWDCIVGPVLESASANEAPIAWSVGVLLFLLIVASARYYRLKKDASQSIHLAPITVTGTLGTKLGSRAAGLLLRAKLIEAFAALRNERTSVPALYMLEDAIGDLINSSFRDRMDPQGGEGGSGDGVPVAKSVNLGSGEVRLGAQEVLKLGPVEIPIAAIARMLGQILWWHPWRRAYHASVIYVSIVAEEGDTRIFVHREGHVGPDPTKSDQTGQMLPTVASSRSNVLSVRANAKTLRELDEAFVDTAYLVLEQWGGVFLDKTAHGMHAFAKGWRFIDAHVNTRERNKKKKIAKHGQQKEVATPDYLQRARESFARAVKLNPHHIEALYCYAALQYHTLGYDGINAAIPSFKRAAEIGDDSSSRALKLRALAHAGLAFCHCQKIHRLAASQKQKEQSQRDADEHAKLAETDWQKALEKEGSSLEDEGNYDRRVRLVQAFALHADEHRKDRQTRFEDAIILYDKVIEHHPNVSSPHNSRGWVYMKLAEWSKDKDFKKTETARDSYAANAERDLKRALELGDSKMTHANLAELYSLPAISKRDKKKYGYWARHHALRAIEIDPQYINGHRTVATTLISYGERLGDAERHLHTALRLAPTTQQVRNIIEEDIASALKRALKAQFITEHQYKEDRWRRPEYQKEAEGSPATATPQAPDKSDTPDTPAVKESKAAD